MYHLPLFPLPNVVLFPRTHLPLHVFEPRYRAMMDHAMEGDRRLGICHLREGYESEYFGSPAVFRIMTAARILYADKLDDGRWNILVEGIERVELKEELAPDPFRVGRVEPIAEEIPANERETTNEWMRRVAEAAETIADHLTNGKRVLSNLVNTHQHPAVVGDIVASALVMESYARQSILEEPNILRRLRLINIQLQLLAHELRETGIEINLPSLD